MADPYVGEIRMFGGTFAPAGWALCNGQLLPISEYEVLFNLIGTTYGGDGQTTFALPNLSGRLPFHQGNGMVVGQMAGEETVSLTVNQLPIHSHPFFCSTNPGGTTNPAGNVPATLPAGNNAYEQIAPAVALNAASVAPDPGGSQPHDNMQPYLCITFIISLFGIFPSQT